MIDITCSIGPFWLNVKIGSGEGRCWMEQTALEVVSEAEEDQDIG